MSNTPTRMTDGEPSGPVGRLKQDTSESIAELRDFLGTMHGKSPQEVLGAVANSGLVVSTLASAVVFGAVLFGMSLATWAFSEKTPAKQVATEATETLDDNAAAPAADKPNTTAATPTASEADDPADDPTAKPAGDAALDALGIGETKTAAPDKNPRSGDLDNLLDDLK